MEMKRGRISGGLVGRRVEDTEYEFVWYREWKYVKLKSVEERLLSSSASPLANGTLCGLHGFPAHRSSHPHSIHFFSFYMWAQYEHIKCARNDLSHSATRITICTYKDKKNWRGFARVERSICIRIWLARVGKYSQVHTRKSSNYWYIDEVAREASKKVSQNTMQFK